MVFYWLTVCLVYIECGNIGDQLSLEYSRVENVSITSLRAGAKQQQQELEGSKKYVTSRICVGYMFNSIKKGGFGLDSREASRSKVELASGLLLFNAFAKVHLCMCIWALGKGHFDVVKETFSPGKSMIYPNCSREQQQQVCIGSRSSVERERFVRKGNE